MRRLWRRFGHICREIPVSYTHLYHETSYDDICNAAHVNRGSIYYHFKEKENIRYEVLWGMHKECQDIAEKYCDRQEYLFKIGSYILWGKDVYKRQAHSPEEPALRPAA